MYLREREGYVGGCWVWVGGGWGVVVLNFFVGGGVVGEEREGGKE